jgi:O-succinylbenzoate synthase
MRSKITVKPYRRRFRKPLRTARGEWAIREGFLLRVESDAGIGYGEAAPIPEFGSETVGAAAAFLQRLVQDLEVALPTGMPCCAFALSAALLMIAEERPLCRPGLLQRPTRRSSLREKDYSVSALLPAGAAVIRTAEAKLALGYRNLKWKIGVEAPGKELASARSLLELLPPGAKLRLDANGSLDRDGLARWLALLADFPEAVDYLEQPLPCGKESAMAEAMQASAVPIALDESLNGAEGARFLTSGAWTGPLVVKAPLMGDVAVLGERLRRIAGQVVLSSVFETGIGLQNVLQLADTLPDMVRPIGMDTVDAFDDALNPVEAMPNICALDRNSYDLEQIWNLL